MTADNAHLQTLLERHRNGDPAAADALIAELTDDCARMVAKQVFERDNRDDVLQEAMLRVLKCLDKVPPQLDNPRAYFLMLTKNVCRDYLRKYLTDKANSLPLELMGDIGDRAPDAAQELREMVLDILFEVSPSAVKKLVYVYNKIVLPEILDRASGSPAVFLERVGALALIVALRQCEDDYAGCFAELMAERFRDAWQSQAHNEGEDAIVQALLGRNPTHSISLWSQRINDRVALALRKRMADGALTP